MTSILAHFIDLINYYRYFILFPLAIVEGPVITMIAGFLTRFGNLYFIPAYFVLVIGDLTGDVLWYAVGYYWGHGFINRFGKFFGISEAFVAIITKFYHKYHNAILIISKLTMGFGLPLVTLVTAGIVKIPFKKYLLLNAIGEFFWTGLLFAVGYFLGNFYLTIYHKFEIISTIALFIFLFIVVFGIGKYIRHIVIKKYS